MSKGYKIVLFLLVLLLAMLTYLEANEPQEVNWNASYSANDKIPLGAHVLAENLKEQSFPMQEVNIPPFEFLKDSSVSGTYFLLNDRLYFDENELEELLSWISEGNTAFLVAEDFSENLLDTLNLELKISPPENGISSRPLLNLSEAALKADEPWLLDRETYNTIFHPTDSVLPEVLGTSVLAQNSPEENLSGVNFLRESFGKGEIYLHSTPKAFSNYFLLHRQNAAYAARALGYIPKEKTLFWDQYYKTGKSFNTSPLFILLNNPQLKWAYYFVLIGTILFVFFEGKRKQRSIPVVAPLQNQTYNFTRTISGLYLDRKDYKAIATKKIALFLDYVRSKFRISTDKKNDEFYQRLAALSGNSSQDVRDLWSQMERLEGVEQVTKEDILNLNKAITTFKTANDGK